MRQHAALVAIAAILTILTQHALAIDTSIAFTPPFQASIRFGTSVAVHSLIKIGNGGGICGPMEWKDPISGTSGSVGADSEVGSCRGRYDLNLAQTFDSVMVGVYKNTLSNPPVDAVVFDIKKGGGACGPIQVSVWEQDMEWRILSLADGVCFPALNEDIKK